MDRLSRERDRLGVGVRERRRDLPTSLTGERELLLEVDLCWRCRGFRVGERERDRLGVCALLARLGVRECERDRDLDPARGVDGVRDLEVEALALA